MESISLSYIFLFQFTKTKLKVFKIETFCIKKKYIYKIMFRIQTKLLKY